MNAYWLAQLLAQAIPPIIHDCTVTEVHFQTELGGWNTDDFLVVGHTGAGSQRRLAGQVKRSFTVSASNDECRKAIQDFWKDFNSHEPFDSSTDRFVLVILRGTNTLLEHFSGLLDCARAASDSSDFEHRLATPGFISATATTYCEAVRWIVADIEVRPVTRADLWPFLRTLYVLSLDLNTPTAQTAAAIKSQLAITATETDVIGAATATWDALLREVGEAAPVARRFRRADLPDDLRRRHRALSTAEHLPLRALIEHSAPVLNGIRTTIGRDLHLSRARLTQEIISQLGSNQVVLVTGGAGSGKSGAARDVVRTLSPEHFVFAFRAEEFKAAHLDETLLRAQIQVNAERLGALLGSQGRKVLLVESLERLLEAAVRDAFSDLLQLVSRDKSWQLILTCREYSAELVRTSLLQTAAVEHAVVSVPLLDDSELETVVATFPDLARPVGSASLRQLLRNPYILDKALRVSWTPERPLPAGEREFRQLFWREVVRADGRAASGLPRRREEVLVQVALRRARALSLHAPCADLDEQAVEALYHDELLSFPEDSRAVAAPAHDVLEDWALLQAIDDLHAVHSGTATKFAEALGAYPATRRAFRNWIGELLDRNASATDELFRAALDSTALPAHFRDDTLIALLRSPASVPFLEQRESLLLADGKRVLRLLIHLLRVGCVTTPSWARSFGVDRQLLLNAPEGPGWECILKLVVSNMALFDAEDAGLLLGLIQDWGWGVSWATPYPPGSNSVATIAYWLLTHFEGHYGSDSQRRVLSIIAKLPSADRERFSALLIGSGAETRRDRVVQEFRELIFTGMEGLPAARDLPDLVEAAARDFLLRSTTEAPGTGYRMVPEPDSAFGIREHLRHEFFPASAFRGPFLPLLRHHPDRGLRLVTAIVDHCTEWYADPTRRPQGYPPPYEVTLTFSDGATRKQWCSGRLWGMYRGVTGGPHVLESLLMTTEHWLLEIARAAPDGLDDLLQRVLRSSCSTALAAVAASVAVAFPKRSQETLMVLVRVRDFVLLDKQRQVHDGSPPSRIFEMMPRVVEKNRLFEEERIESDRLPHRQRDLESAIFNLQFGPNAARIQAVLDQCFCDLPPLEQQDEDDRLWRLALCRMDLRRYTQTPQSIGAATNGHSDRGESQPAGATVRLDLVLPDPDIKEMVEKNASENRERNALLGLHMWGYQIFRRQPNSTYSPAGWREVLGEARRADGVSAPSDEIVLGQGGPGYVAAVCVRDHWDDLAADERAWCVDRICAEVGRGADVWNPMTRHQRFDMSADRPCAFVLPSLVGKALMNEQSALVQQALAQAVTHPMSEVRQYAIWGIAEYLWSIDAGLTLRCVGALALEATMLQRALDSRRRDEPESLEWRDKDAADVVRKNFFIASGIPDDSYDLLNPSCWFGAEAETLILAILKRAPTNPVSIAGFERAAKAVVAWWAERDEDPSSRERNFEAEAAVTDHLVEFLLRTSPDAANHIIEPIVEVAVKHDREASQFLLQLIAAEDRAPNSLRFWSLWSLFADKVRNAGWLGRLDREHSHGTQLISALFLGTRWKENARHWRSLEQSADGVHRLFDDLPATSVVLDAYARFLFDIGHESLPHAFIRISKRLHQGDPVRMLRRSNTRFHLERLLAGWVYGKPLLLKRQSDLREAVLYLLDVLVERGSSAAFRMRDDFVTPLPAS